jgi:hypothetical protein
MLPMRGRGQYICKLCTKAPNGGIMPFPLRSPFRWPRNHSNMTDLNDRERVTFINKVTPLAPTKPSTRKPARLTTLLQYHYFIQAVDVADISIVLVVGLVEGRRVERCSAGASGSACPCNSPCARSSPWFASLIWYGQ